MKALDTNILVRFLTGDDGAQANAVYAIFKNAESSKKRLYVPLPVVLELIWVLESVYEISRNEIVAAIGDLLLMPILEFDQRPVLYRLISSASAYTGELSDLLLAYCANRLDIRGLLLPRTPFGKSDRKALRLKERGQ